MLIDSLIIKLIREGAGIGPDYRLTIYGDGKVIYEGVEIPAALVFEHDVKVLGDKD